MFTLLIFEKNLTVAEIQMLTKYVQYFSSVLDFSDGNHNQVMLKDVPGLPFCNSLESETNREIPDINHLSFLQHAMVDEIKGIINYDQILQESLLTTPESPTESSQKRPCVLRNVLHGIEKLYLSMDYMNEASKIDIRTKKDSKLNEVHYYSCSSNIDLSFIEGIPFVDLTLCKHL